MGLPDLVKTCDLFVYLNVQFRSFQFEEEEQEEVPSTFVANIHHIWQVHLSHRQFLWGHDTSTYHLKGTGSAGRGS